MVQTSHGYAREARATLSAGSALSIQQRPTDRLLLCGQYSGGCSIKKQGRLPLILSAGAPVRSREASGLYS
jgi:hypothetical protein